MDDGDLKELIESLVLSNQRLHKRCFKVFGELGDERAKVAELERILEEPWEAPIDLERCVECGVACSEC